jgi:hypothetical protein
MEGAVAGRGTGAGDEDDQSAQKESGPTQCNKIQEKEALIGGCFHS